VGVAEPVSGYIGGAPARVQLVVRLGLRALQLTAFPRRFSHMSLERRSRHLEKLESSRFSFLRDLFLLFKTLTGVGYSRDLRVQQVIGVEACCVGTPSPLRLDADTMRAPSDVERCDVVVVGSGAGGASVARVLSEAGMSVIVVEEGDYYDASSYSTDVFEALPRLYRDSGLTVAEGRPAIPLPIGRCVGGTTVINSGTCFRAPGDILTRWRDDHGLGWACDLDGEFEGAERDARGGGRGGPQRRAVPDRRRGDRGVQPRPGAQRRRRDLLPLVPNRLRGRRQDGHARVRAAARGGGGRVDPRRPARHARARGERPRRGREVPRRL
jgi:hypothetical protein